MAKALGSNQIIVTTDLFCSVEKQQEALLQKARKFAEETLNLYYACAGCLMCSSILSVIAKPVTLISFFKLK